MSYTCSRAVNASSICSLADLEWLVAPAIQNRQVVTAHAQNKQTGQIIPVAAVAWALLTEERVAELKASKTGAGACGRMSGKVDRPLTLPMPKVIQGLCRNY